MRLPLACAALALALISGTAVRASTHPEGDDPAGLALCDVRAETVPEGIRVDASLCNRGSRTERVFVEASWGYELAVKPYDLHSSRLYMVSVFACGFGLGPFPPDPTVDPGKRMTLEPRIVGLHPDEVKELGGPGIPVEITMEWRITRRDGAGRGIARFTLETEALPATLPPLPAIVHP